jgi:alkanesulfonate monooxygenase SsuD/methylene tetrahydromethanopterin reductase-like flavin-dependent oxidoreductase (luciferase family)
LQQPHPPIWLPSQGSTETIQWAAQRRYPFVSVFTSAAQTKRLVDEYKAAAEAAGYTAPPGQIGCALPTYVAETDERARVEARPHIEWLFHRGLKIPPHFLLPPGYITEESLRKFLATGLRAPSDLSYEELEAGGYILVGSARTVADRLIEIRKSLDFGIFIGAGRIGDMPHDKAIKSMELFAHDVMPRLRHSAPPATSKSP